jgi:hypothetical protein
MHTHVYKHAGTYRNMMSMKHDSPFPNMQVLSDMLQSNGSDTTHWLSCDMATEHMESYIWPITSMPVSNKSYEARKQAKGVKGVKGDTGEVTHYIIDIPQTQAYTYTLIQVITFL